MYMNKTIQDKIAALFPAMKKTSNVGNNPPPKRGVAHCSLAKFCSYKTLKCCNVQHLATQNKTNTPHSGDKYMQS